MPWHAPQAAPSAHLRRSDASRPLSDVEPEREVGLTTCPASTKPLPLLLLASSPAAGGQLLGWPGAGALAARPAALLLLLAASPAICQPWLLAGAAAAAPPLPPMGCGAEASPREPCRRCRPLLLPAAADALARRAERCARACSRWLAAVRRISSRSSSQVSRVACSAARCSGEMYSPNGSSAFMSSSSSTRPRKHSGHSRLRCAHCMTHCRWKWCLRGGRRRRSRPDQSLCQEASPAEQGGACSPPPPISRAQRGKLTRKPWAPQGLLWCTRPGRCCMCLRVARWRSFVGGR